MMYLYQRIFGSIGRSINTPNRLFFRPNIPKRHFILSTYPSKDLNFTPQLSFKSNKSIYSSILSNSNLINQKRFSSSSNQNGKGEEVLTVAQKLKKAAAEYGPVVIIFHVGISLISLGICYTLVSSGLDLAAVVSYLGINLDGESKLATNAGTFVVAYAVHKVFAPARIAITLTSTPFIVKHLRKIGWLKYIPKK
nr:protein FAM210B, mitochondrial-like [Onthophagus taurus]